MKPPRRSGRAPRTLTATKDADRYLVSNISDYDRGLSTLVLTRDTGGKVTKAEMTAISLTQPGEQVRIDRLDIQRAQSAVLVTVDGVEYAIVSDDNYHFMDPYWKAMYEAPDFLYTPSGPPIAIGGSATAKKVAVGGKLGIVKDPFGNAQYLGATLPLDGYGIINLGVSEDGTVLIGQLKGGFSGNLALTGVGSSTAFPSQSHAWNVAGLIHAALAMPDKDRMSKHINVLAYPNIEQLVKNNVGLVAGTFFDDEVVKVETQGNMGDVIGVNLRELAAKQLLVKEGKLAASFLTTAWDKLDANTQHAIIMRMEQLTDFTLSIDDQAYFSKNGADSVLQPFKLVTKGNTIVSRAFADPACTAEDDFSHSGVLFFVPTIGDSEEAKLRAGKTLDNQEIGFMFHFKDQANAHASNPAPDKQGFATLTAMDYATSSNVFFGDRPLDNPGYSAFTLKGTIGVGQANDLLDVYRVEQRLKYLGFPAMGAGKGNTLKPFTVDGNWGTQEGYAALLFDDVVNYGPNYQQIVYRKGKATNKASFAIDLQAFANAEHISNTSGKNFQYLNSYNAPHWMNVYQSIQGRGLKVTSGMATSENYGVSWMRDLMVASQYADARLQPGTIRFNGAVDANLGFTPYAHATHDLGMAFDLGVSNRIAIDGAQTDPNEILLSALISAIGDPTTVSWSVDKAVNFSALLSNVTNPKILNNQVSAIRDFLSLYAVTQSDGSATALTHIVNGSTTLFSGMISNVIIGGQTYTDSKGKTHIQNTYPNIRKVLDGLGIKNSTFPEHNSHFHIYLKPPTPVEITATQHLLANTATNATSTPVTLQTDAQGLLDYTQNIIEGEELMFTMDVPSVPAQQAPIVLAQAATPATPAPDFILKVCKETEQVSTIFGGIDPAYMLKNFLYAYSKGKQIADLASIKISLLESTQHGKVDGEFVSGRLAFMYNPTEGYFGKDKATFMAEFEGKRYKIILDIHVVTKVDEGDSPTTTCPDPKLIKVNGKPVLGATDYNLDNITVTFADLPAGALGQTTGSSITLDTNAAGNGWYIDLTPSDNSEYLPTSNPNEWVAKAGSAAAGKMDMLTVLLHEYGHALGIDHNPDAHDYMGTTLTAGIRRLPTPDELALMGQLVAQAKSGLASSNTQDNVPNPFPSLPLGGMSLAFAGLLQRNRYGSLNAVLNNSTLSLALSHQGRGNVVQYAVAANSTLVNGSLNNGSGWNTQGSVNIGNGIATLSEVSTTQTRLNQVFMVNTHDRYLSFTLSGSRCPVAADVVLTTLEYTQHEKS